MAFPVLKGTGGIAIVLMVTAFCLRGESACAQVTTAAGLNDLVILDPGKHERGLPAVEIKDVPGGKQIDIPPKLHVHRYYYSGDKIFQGPILQGGPVVVVANHPKTGEQMNVSVVLPPGTPRIAHSKNSISYIYNDHKRVEVKFQSFPFDPCVAVVKHHSGKGAVRTVKDAGQHVREGVKETMTNSTVLNSIKDAAAEGADLVLGARTAIGDFSKQGTDTVKQFSDMIPGVTYLKSLAEQGPQKQYEGSVRRKDVNLDRKGDAFVRTNR